MLDGRVKTLHPKIHGGILAQLDNKKHTEEKRKYEIKPINMVVVNLYDFESVYKKQGNMPLREALEQIDIGGPTLLRAAAKNFPYVVAVCDPADYPKLMEEIKRDGGVSGLTRLALAKKVFEMISKYDAMIAKFLDGALKSLKWSIGIAAEIQVGMKLA